MIHYPSLFYRLIMLGLPGGDSVSQAGDVFWATIGEPSANKLNQLQVRKGNSQTVMAELEAQAQSREWEVEKELEFKDRQVPDSLLSLVAASWEVAVRSLQKEAEVAESLTSDRIVSGIRRTLLAKAQRILDRKTIVCLPPEGDEWCQVAQRIGNEVYERLAGGELAWSFVQLRRDSDPNTERDKITPMGTLLETLQMKVAGAPLESLPQKKPGPTLMVGETGTGKTMAAQLFFVLSGRAKFHPINLSAVSKGLLEARLRGSKKGAYTSSVADQKGWFETANGGILFLDELQSADIEFQTQLLDLLDPSTNEVRVAPVGDDEKRKPFDVKVMLAINEEIETLIAENRLRKDIFYRIRNIVRMPALRTRLANDENGHLIRVLLSVYRWKSASAIAKSDLESMTIDRKASLFPPFTPAALEQLRKHSWPGNLREFERVANDLYWDFDEDTRPDRSIGADEVVRAINIFNIGEVQAPSLHEDSFDQRALQDVQAALREENFVLKRAMKKLGRYKLSGYESLKRYLRENQALLDPDVLADSKFKRLFAKPGSAVDAPNAVA